MISILTSHHVRTSIFYFDSKYDKAHENAEGKCRPALRNKRPIRLNSHIKKAFVCPRRSPRKTSVMELEVVERDQSDSSKIPKPHAKEADDHQMEQKVSLISSSLVDVNA